MRKIAKFFSKITLHQITVQVVQPSNGDETYLLQGAILGGSAKIHYFVTDNSQCQTSLIKLLVAPGGKHNKRVYQA